MEHLDLSGRLTGPGHTPYVIAEIGANHNGDMALCRQMIREAARCGADAVKFQSWTAESLISSAEYGRNAAYNDPERHFGSLKEMVERYQLSAAQHREVGPTAGRRASTSCRPPSPPPRSTCSPN